MNPNVIRAIFKRNFISYFSNPTGYVFICVFVLLSSFAAFWPSEFFNANLANLDQLNKYLPFILLVFIPAITMSVWADERRLGTDELLLTIPAGDFDVVMGKYLAAVAIYTVSLVFSLVSNLLVLALLTSWSLDFGLFFGTYFGYWIVGLAMLAVGMAASFLTSNLTVAFILGALFNAPLVFASMADTIVKDQTTALAVKEFGIAEQFRDFSRGVVSLSTLTYFLAIVAVMLYLSMVLIGRRHWRGGNEGRGMAVHYLVRFVALLGVVAGLTAFMWRHDRLRVDVTQERLNSLAPQTKELLANLDAKYPVHIDAYISPIVPESYVPTRLNLISTLREFEALGGNKVIVHRHDVEPFSKEATDAEQQFGIKPQSVESRTRGARTRDEIFLGLAFTCGLEKTEVPFIGKGIPTEYELVRSIATVSQQKRKKIGVLTTDAKLFGGFDMQTMSSTPSELLIEELKKQYDVVQVDPTGPIAEKYDVLLAVQPSSLAQPQMDNFVTAVKQGQPTAIFEDPFPYLAQDVPGTKAPKQPPGGMNPFMGGGHQPPQPKGNIAELWRTLGIDFNGDNVVWQNYNPYPKLGPYISPEWVFVGPGVPQAKQPLNEKEPISSNLQQLLFLFPGSVRGMNSSTLKFTELVSTGDRTGTVRYDDIIERNAFMGGGRINPELRNLERPTGEKYVLAAHIQGKPKAENVPMSDKAPEDDPADGAAENEAGDPKNPPEGAAPEQPASDKASSEPAEPTPEKNSPGKSSTSDKSATDKTADKKPAAKASPPEKPANYKDGEINVVLVADIDCLYSAFFALRARGEDQDDEVSWDFDNVTFILNALDFLAGDQRFVDIRKRRPEHHTLTRVSEVTGKAKEEADQTREKFVKEFNDAKAAEQRKFDERIRKLKEDKNVTGQQALQEIVLAQQSGQRRLDIALERLKQNRDTQIKQAERELAMEIKQIQDQYKLQAVMIPPLLPLALAIVVFFNRRAHEREGVSKARLR